MRSLTPVRVSNTSLALAAARVDLAPPSVEAP